MVFKNHSTYSSSSGSHGHDNLTAGMGSLFADSQRFRKPVVIFYYQEEIRADMISETLRLKLSLVNLKLS